MTIYLIPRLRAINLKSKKKKKNEKADTVYVDVLILCCQGNVGLM